ncbi:MAG: hypothetical protein FWG40_00625 [Peptococcaceae bacterium]|nr:hypothetical protein [Peptococcaceae bacterium]
MDWLSSGRRDTFRYVLVDKETMAEGEDLGMFVDGGRLDFDDLSPLKVSGSLPYYAPPDVGFNYLRVYSTSYLKGEEEEIMHGTFLVSTPGNDIRGALRVGSADIYSTLKIVADASPDTPVTLPAGTDAISYAAGLITSLGLPVLADASTYQLNTMLSWDAGTPYLEIINELCVYAGFNSADVDPSGQIRLYRYLDPAIKQPTVEFDDKRCTFNPTIKYNFDIFDIPNKFVVVLSNAEEEMSAVAINDDPLSPYSTISQGREISRQEKVSDMEGLGTLQAYARRRLAEVSSAVESIEIAHTFIPYNTGDVARLIYTKADFAFLGVAVTKSVSLSCGMPCNTRVRRFVRG